MRSLDTQLDFDVAPFTGAWIEMIGSKALSGRRGVAPFTGAWIEIHELEKSTGCGHTSHPSRVRGLKSRRRNDHQEPLQVAPFTGAWIEISTAEKSSPSSSSSHPSRVRGLKYLK